MNGLLLRAMAAFLLFPGTVAFLIPVSLLAPDGARRFVRPWAFAPLAVGCILLLWCVREFYVAGRGTLAPWSPPKHLVVTGPYRFSRNPMYLAVVLILWSWAAGFASRRHAGYAALMMVVFHVRVVMFEEPWVAAAHGPAWVRYRASVQRWFGRAQHADQNASVEQTPARTEDN